ncbi:hypothetical protein CHLRE_06g301476v5 [Chlamydomonas reinhardtii]|uniref:Uncharacterized protein n=1 Tax=Chlamydomonas reinhardtii TaxID=3055 RepID=A0A2K3DQZ2_CHLRE|nr:uncharacterized protein CHLRE_06g301476v5 [Chlamydomonas reinhardtii]PNW82965.1 hypothetical protein CHLRE_06g301476v5 [Chlamydomonas reinhardtii]
MGTTPAAGPPRSRTGVGVGVGQLREWELAVAIAAGWEAACQDWTCMDSMVVSCVLMLTER